jgi:hypothetical membrane protein
VGVSAANLRWAGLLMAVGAGQFAISLTVALAVHPRFSVSHDFLGDLGLGPTALLFNASISLLGLAFLAAASLLYRGLRHPGLVIAVALTGIGALGFGLIPATDADELIHTAFSFLAFIFGAVSALLAYRILQPPLRQVSAGLGTVSLVALGLLVTHFFVPILDRGWAEQLIVWPILLWAFTTGGSFIARSARAYRGAAPPGPRTA